MRLLSRYGGFLLYFRIITPLVWFGTCHEFVLNEAFICLQKDESEFFVVPSWGDLEIAHLEKRESIEDENAGIEQGNL